MTEDVSKKQAKILVERARKLQMDGEFADAILLFRRSISLHPTVDAFTFLGLTYAMMNRYQEAIDSCKMAIEVDAEFGQPYNDIGAYLIRLHQWEQAVPWLEKAINAPNYQERQNPLMHLGRIYEHQGRYRTALNYYDKALEIDPMNLVCTGVKYDLLGQLN
jgi:tetratricopeptide (TPR) repeat protein